MTQHGQRYMQRGRRDIKRDRALELIRMAGLYGVEHFAPALAEQSRVSRREREEHVALGRLQREEIMKALGENQKAALRAVARHKPGWYQGGPLAITGFSARPVFEALAKHGFVQLVSRFVPNRGTVAVFIITPAGERFAESLEGAKCAN